MKDSLTVETSATSIENRRVTMRDLSLISGRRTLGGIIIAAAMAALCLPALAVEDGQGTNVVKNMRVKDNGTLSLGGTSITNWSQVSGAATDQTARDAAAAAQATATYGSNMAITAESDAAAAQAAAEAAQSTATYGSNTAKTAISDAAAAQSTATYGSNTAVTAISDAATAQAAAEAAQADASAATNGLTLKYDKAGGTISGNVTFGSNTVYTISSQVALADNASINPANAAAVKIAGAAGAVTNVGISAGNAGQILTLIGVDDAKPVKICATSPNVVLTENVDFTMGSNAVLQVIYTGAKWAEMHRATPN